MLNANDAPGLPLQSPLAAIDDWLPQDHWDGSAAIDRPFGRPARSDSISAALQARWLQVLLCLAAALPLMWPHVVPLTDLGGHLGRFAVQIDGGRSASLRQWYSFHWTPIPNLGTDLLMQLLAPHMGLEPALKTIVMGIVVTQAAGFLALARVAHGRVTPTAVLALPLVYGYPFHYGFLNYTLATALGTWALTLWIAMDRPALRNARWLAFVPISCALWICHLEGWVLFCILAAGCEFAHWRARSPVAWSAVLQRSAAPLSCLIVPVLLFAFWPHADGPRGETGVWFDVIGKLGMIVMAMRDRWGVWDVASALALVGVTGWSWRASGRGIDFDRHAGLALGAVIAVVAFALVPKHIGGTSYVDMRLVPMILAIALIAVRPREDCPRRTVEMLTIFALLFVGARFAGNAASMALYDRQFGQDLAVLDSLPRDSLLVSLTIKPCVENDPWMHERRTHLAGYALARRHAFANDQWTMAGGQLLRVHAPAMGRFTGDPSQTASPEACRGRPGVTRMVEEVPSAVQYLWILENGMVRHYDGWHPIRLSPGSVLYARDQTEDWDDAWYQPSRTGARPAPAFS